MSKRKTSTRDWTEEAVDMETLVQWDGRGECDHLNLYGRHVIAMFRIKSKKPGIHTFLAPLLL